MFTGIVTAIGTIESIEQRGDLRVRVSCPWDPERIGIGASIACAGVCLTAVERGGAPGDAWFAVDVSAETVSRTAKGMWRQGERINLEGSLKVGDELGGHIVSGHVDAVGVVANWEPQGDSMRVTVLAPRELAPFIAPFAEAITKSTLKQYRHSTALTELRQFEGRGHSLTIDSGWREVAEIALAFIRRFVEPR